jgi:hypothetical protein
MNARLTQWSIVFSVAAALVAVATDNAEGQIFRRPGRVVPSKPAVTKPAESKPGGEKSANVERVVVTPLDETPFKVEADQLVRLPADGIAGSERSAKIEGPARLRYKTYISQRSEGQELIGGGPGELEFELTGTGKVKIDVIVTYPSGDKPKVTTYRFEVVPARKYPEDGAFAPAPAKNSGGLINPAVN